MRSVNVVLILVAVVVTMVTASPSSRKVYYDLEDAAALFEQFIRDYNKHYKDIADKYIHFQAFVATLASINKLNLESPTATYDINQFSDYTDEERKKLNGIKWNSE